MKSHTYDFARKDLLQFVAGPLLPLALFAAAMHGGPFLGLLPAPRPTLDVERTILIHQAEACRTRHDAEVVLLGDSSCLMDVSARQLGDQLGRPVLSLATFSFLDLSAQALLLREYAKTNHERMRVVVLLMHGEALRRVGSESYYLGVLSNFWAGRDECRTEDVLSHFSCLLGVECFKGRILSRVVPVPLSGTYGRRYGFNVDLERYLTREHGSAVDPEPQPFQGRAEYRLSPTLERASRAFRAAVPPGAKLFVGLTPAPARFAGPGYPQLHLELLRQWSRWLEADATLTDLPATLPDDSFVRATHLSEKAVPLYTKALGAALETRLR